MLENVQHIANQYEARNFGSVNIGKLQENR